MVDLISNENQTGNFVDHGQDDLAFLQGHEDDDVRVSIKEFSMLQTKFSAIGGSLQGTLIE